MTREPNLDPDPDAVRRVANEIYGEQRGVRPNRKPKKRRRKVTQRRHGPKGRTSPVIEYVRSLGDDYKTTQEVADELGLAPNTVRKFAKDADLKGPSYVAPFGRTVVRLYTEADVQELRNYLGQRRKVYPREEYERDH